MGNGDVAHGIDSIPSSDKHFVIEEQIIPLILTDEAPGKSVAEELSNLFEDEQSMPIYADELLDCCENCEEYEQILQIKNIKLHIVTDIK